MQAGAGVGFDDVFADQLHQAAVAILQDDQAEEAGEDDDEGDGHFEEGADDGGHAGGAEAVGSEDALDDEEVGGPVAEADGEAEAEDDAGPVDAHGVVLEVAHAAPHVGVVSGGDCADRHVVGDFGFESVPAAGFDKAEDGDQERAAPDEDEL